MSHSGFLDEDEAFEALQKSLVRVDPINVNLNGKRNEPVTDVVAQYSIPLIRGPKGSYYAHARGFGDHKLERDQIRPLQMFQLINLACEDPSLGCPHVNVNRTSKSQLYWRVIRAYCKQKMGTATEQEKRLVKQYMFGFHYVNFQTQKDIAEMMTKVKQESEKQNGDLFNDHDDDNDEEEQRVDELRSELSQQRQQEQPVVAVDRQVDWHTLVEQFSVVCRHDHPRANEPDIQMSGQDTFLEANISLFSRKIRHLYPTISVVQSTDLNELNDVPITDLLTHEEIDAMAEKGGMLKPKVELAVMPVPSAHDPDYIQAYLCTFLVYDPLFNPGEIVHKLFEVQKQRDVAAVRTGRFASRWTDPFQRYEPLKKLFPAFNMDRDEYLNICAAFLGKQRFERAEYWNSKADRFDGVHNRLHPSKVCNMSVACRMMAEAGCDVRYLNASGYWDPERQTFQWPSCTNDVFIYTPDAFNKWYNKRYIGLMEQNFPGRSFTDSILSFQFKNENLMKLYMESTEDPILSDQERQYIIHEHMEQLRNSPMGDPVINRNRILEQLGYTTSKFPVDNSMIRLWLAREELEPKIEAFRPADLVALKKEYEREKRKGQRALDTFKQTQRYIEWRRYQRLLNRLRLDFTNELETLCQKEGGREYLGISDALKSMLEWYEKNFIAYDQGQRKERSFTRDLKLIDKDMSFFGNSMIRNQEIMVQYFKVMQPVVSLMVEHAYCIYDWEPGRLKFHLMVHGKKASGKTRNVLKIPKKCSIPGTITDVAHQTDMVKFTDTQMYDRIEFHDETDARYTDAKEAAKTPRWRDLMKQALQAGMSQSEVYVGTDNGRRHFREFITIQNLLMICVTNKELSDPEALSNRFIQKTVGTLKDVNANLYNWETTEQGERSAKLQMQMLQFFSAWVKKARMVGAICSYDLSVWDFVFNGVIERLKERGLEFEGEPRIKEKLDNVVKQYVTHMAQHYVYDIEGVSPYYGQHFDVSHMREIQRHLVADMETCGFALTMFPEELMDTDAFVIFSAIPRIFGLKWHKGMSMLDLFRLDIHNKMDFRTRGRIQTQQYQHNRAPHTESGQKIDLNYIRLNGTWEEICKNIANNTFPQRLGANDVAGALSRLDGKFFTPSSGPSGRNGYAQQPKEQFLKRFQSEQVVPKVVRGQSEVYLVEDLRALVNEYAQRFFRLMCKRYVYDGFNKMTVSQDWDLFYNQIGIDYNLTKEDILILYHTRFMEGRTLREMTNQYPAQKEQLARQLPVGVWSQLADMTNTSLYVLQHDFNHLTSGMLLAFWYALKDGYVRGVDDPEGCCIRPKSTSGFGISVIDDIPEMDYGGVGGDDQHKLKIIEIRKGKGGLTNVYVALEAIFMFDPEMIYQAWLETCVSQSFRTGKYLLGMPDPKYPTRLAVRMVNQDTKTRTMDMLRHEGEDRRQGITLHRMGHITPSVQDLLFETPLTSHMTREEWQHVCANEKSVRGSGQTIIEDMELQAYYNQHMKAGLDLDEEVVSPQWYMDRYMLHHRNQHVKPHFNYPFSILHDQQQYTVPVRKTGRRKLHSSLQQITREAELDFYNSNSAFEDSVSPDLTYERPHEDDEDVLNMFESHREPRSRLSGPAYFQNLAQ